MSFRTTLDIVKIQRI